MKLLPIRIEIQRLLHDRGKEKTYLTVSEHTLQINEFYQKKIFELINEEIENIVKDFDLSSHAEVS